MNAVRHGWLVLGILAGASIARGAVIDFETTPVGGAPTDNTFLPAPYNLAGGGTVAFFFDVNGNNTFDPGVDGRPVFEAYGPDGSDAYTYAATSDSAATPALAAQLGGFFLRQLQPGPAPPAFIVDYNTAQPIYGLSGEIWDVDGAPGATEQWKVDALDASNNLLTSQTSFVGNDATTDGTPWVFSFMGLPAGFDKLRITFIGTKTTDLGMAFNNFEPLAVPEPASWVLASVGGMALLAVASRARRRQSR